MIRMENFDRYIRGLMSPEEEREYLASLRDGAEEGKLDDLDDDAVADALTAARITEAMRGVGRERNTRIEEELSAMSREEVAMLARRITLAENMPAAACIPAGRLNKPARLRAPRRRRRWPLAAAAAAAVLIIGGALYIIRCNRYDSVVAENVSYLPSGQGSGYIRGDGESVDLSTFSGRIEAGEAEEVTGALERMWRLSGSDTYNDYTNSRADIGWLLANAYLAEHRKEEALTVLRTLASEYPAQSPFGRRVADFIKRIEEI